MKWIISLLVLLSGLAATADPLAERPISREELQEAKLAVVRPLTRPPHMLRYPVTVETRAPEVRPIARDPFLPRARWDFQEDGRMWTRAAMSAVEGHAEELVSLTPQDIERWCPGYETASADLRRAFWVGMMSALSKHESTYNPSAVGGGNLWYGLLQIYPDTARRYDCRARTGEALKNPADNLSCAARIMAVTVARDDAVAIYDGRWRGVAADWGPMSNRSKISEMASWTSRQTYCVPINGVRPIARPNLPEAISTMTATPEPD